MKILVDLPELTRLDVRLTLGPMLARAGERFAGYAEAAVSVGSFMGDRLAYLLEQRGFDVRNIRAVMHGRIDTVSPLDARRKLEALAHMSGSQALLGVATLLKRVKNITKGIAVPTTLDRAVLREPAELQLLTELDARAPVIRDAATRADYKDAFTAIAALQPAVAKFFDDVLVMAEDEQVRTARLGLVATLRDLILEIADISEIVTD